MMPVFRSDGTVAMVHMALLSVAQRLRHSPSPVLHLAAAAGGGWLAAGTAAGALLLYRWGSGLCLPMSHL